MKKILVLSGSPRIKGNSDLICDEFTRGAKEAENDVEKIHVASKKIAQCLVCYYCREHHGECVQKDAMADVLQKMINADVIVPSSAVFFYSITAQLKAVIDRTVARWLEAKTRNSTSSSRWRMKILNRRIAPWPTCKAMSIACKAAWSKGPYRQRRISTR